MSRQRPKWDQGYRGIFRAWNFIAFLLIIVASFFVIAPLRYCFFRDGFIGNVVAGIWGLIIVPTFARAAQDGHAHTR